MNKCANHEELLEQMAVLKGQMAETAAKARMLFDIITTKPECVDEVEIQLNKLEAEQERYISAIQDIVV